MTKHKTHPHPAKFSDQVLAAMSIMLDTWCRDLPAVEDCWPIVLDPFAGVGRVVELARPEANWRWVLNEIEPEWAADCAHAIEAARVDGIVVCRDWLAAAGHPAWFGACGLVVTSPTYGNRMADRHEPSAEDRSTRITYRHKLGRRLSQGNSGGMQWGDAYRLFHIAAWERAWEALLPGGFFLVNVKNHVRDGEVQPVVDWHKTTLEAVGFDLVEERWVAAPGMRFGANRDVRVDYESVILWRKPT